MKRVPHLGAWAAFTGCGVFAALLNTLGDLAAQPWLVRVPGPFEVFVRFLPPWLIAAWLGFGLRELILRRTSWLGERPAPLVLAHLAGAALFPLIQLYLVPLTHELLGILGPDTVWQVFIGLLPRYYLLGVVTYIAAAAAIHAIEYARESSLRERGALALEASLADARLAALKHQLSPHFLFNALNTVGMLIRQDRPADALDTLARFGDLMRDVLDAPGHHEVSLEEELGFIRRYLEVEQIRFHDRLDITVRHDPGIESALVPHMILQPLVENAVLHGIARKTGPGRVTVTARQRNGCLVLSVIDDGAGLSGNSHAGPAFGIGLGNTRDRLQQIYGALGRLAVTAAEGGGVRASVEIPFRRLSSTP